MSCHHAFLFSFVNPSGLGPTKLSLKTGQEGRGIYCDSNYGPVLGGGGDIWISKDINKSPLSRSNLGKKPISSHQDNRARSSQVLLISPLQTTRCLDSASDNYQAGEINSYF